MNVKHWKVIEENEEIIQEFQGYKKGLVRYGSGGWALRPKTAETVGKIRV